MHSICILVTQLIEYVMNTLVVLGNNKFADDPLKPNGRLDTRFRSKDQYAGGRV